MTMKSIRLQAMLTALALTAAVALVPSLRADDTGQPASGAARLSSVDGQVRISQGGQVIADPAPINAPLFVGTRVETGDDGKAEIQFDDGSVARVSPDSAVTITAVGSHVGTGGTELVLEGGLAYFEMQGGGPGGIPMRVTFGDSAATATGFTVIRIRMDNPPGELAVFSGNAHLDRGNSLSLDIHGGESLALNATDPTRYNLTETIEPDSWDSWNSDRDQALSAETVDQTGAASNFVNSNTPSPAWNDLDANGNWYNVPGQGYIWSPYDASDASWDPYGNGNWMWTPGYGYIFVSGYSWGYMPFQCGSWNFYDGFGWGWAPGMGMGAGLRMGGCHPWWSTGRYFGPNIGRGPGGYRNIEMPRNRGPVGRTPPKIVRVDRGGFHGVQGSLPPRTRNSPVQIGGATVAPLRPLPGNRRYEPSQSGFVYHPRGSQASGSGGYGNGNGYTARPGSEVHTSPGNRQVYEPSQGPRYTSIPTPRPPVDNSAVPGVNNPNPGANNGNPNPGDQPPNNGGKPPMGGLVPRGYNGGYTSGTGQVNTVPNPGSNPGSNPANPSGGNDQRVRPWNPGGYPSGGQNPRPSGNGGNPGAGNNGAGGSFQRPSGGNPGGSNPNGGGSFQPRPSGGNSGGGNSGGGGSPRPAPSGGGGGGGGSAPHGGGGTSSASPHNGNPK
jgi:hypothetical protein